MASELCEAGAKCLMFDKGAYLNEDDHFTKWPCSTSTETFLENEGFFMTEDGKIMLFAG